MATTVVNIAHERRARRGGFRNVGRPTRWGNPWRVGVDGLTREQALELYRVWVQTSDDEAAWLVRALVFTLHGQRLGCWCVGPEGATAAEPLVCHAQILAGMADQTEGRPIVWTPELSR